MNERSLQPFEQARYRVFMHVMKPRGAVHGYPDIPIPVLRKGLLGVLPGRGRPTSSDPR
jgi:hypothetical protein